MDPAVPVEVALEHHLGADLDREHLHDAGAVVVGRVATEAGVLVEVGPAAGVARGQVVAAEAAGLVVGGDLGGAIKGFRSALKEEENDSSDQKMSSGEGQVIEGEVENNSSNNST